MASMIWMKSWALDHGLDSGSFCPAAIASGSWQVLQLGELRLQRVVDDYSFERNPPLFRKSRLASRRAIGKPLGSSKPT
jgi:hypothetical protein